jgi:formylglycine-generating enzyme required for sulfatase activity
LRIELQWVKITKGVSSIRGDALPVTQKRAVDLVPTGATNAIVWNPDGTFRMDSDVHYVEEAPAHRVSVDGFWIDVAPVTNRQFRKFVNASGYMTTAEISPDANDYPGALYAIPSNRRELHK